MGNIIDVVLLFIYYLLELSFITYFFIFKYKDVVDILK